MNLLPPLSLTFGTNSMFEFVVEPMTIQRNIKPKTIRYGSLTGEGLKPLASAMRTLSDQYAMSLAQHFLFEIPQQGWADSEMSDVLENKGENHKLVVMSALCRIGVFAQDDGYWRRTWFGDQLESRRGQVSFYAFIRGEWTYEMRQDFVHVLGWAWEALESSDVRECFDCIVSQPTGFSHADLPQPAKGNRTHKRKISLRAMAAAAAVGAVWFSGWSWMPTLYGSWLSNHPQSPLNAK